MPATHTWQVTKFNADTVEHARCALALQLAWAPARPLGSHLTFLGYHMERRRMAGRRHETYLPVMWRASHRYAGGKNAANYRLAGCRLLCTMLRAAGTPTDPVLLGLYKVFYDGEAGDLACRALHDRCAEVGWAPWLELLTPAAPVEYAIQRTPELDYFCSFHYTVLDATDWGPVDRARRWLTPSPARQGLVYRPASEQCTVVTLPARSLEEIIAAADSPRYEYY